MTLTRLTLLSATASLGLAAGLLLAPAASAATTCPTDGALPVPVTATAVDTLTTAQKTVEGKAGPLPVDVAGTVSSAAGCTTTTPKSGDTKAAPVHTTSTTGAALATSLPAARAAKTVNASPALAG